MALAVVLTLLFGSFVIIVFLHRKQGELRVEGIVHRELFCSYGDGWGGAELLSMEVHGRRKGDFFLRFTVVIK